MEVKMMPIWRYRCDKCGNEVEELVLSRDVEVRCDKCGNKMDRQIPARVGVKFNGSGYYSTENKKEE